VLQLDRNQISDITPLENVTSLTRLELWGNQIGDIIPLASLTNLTVLRLEENEISDISSLTFLTKLTDVSLEKNEISDISPLVENTGLGEGDEVCLRDNNLDLSEGSKDRESIETLEERGVKVAY
jgi:Leucine-rich repeat (LRR) protein